MKHSVEKYLSARSQHFRVSFLIAAAFAAAATLGLAQTANAQRGGGGHGGHDGGHAGVGHSSGAHTGAAVRSAVPASRGMHVTYLPASSSRTGSQMSAPGSRPFRGEVGSRTPIAGNFFRHRVTLRRRNGFFPGQFGFGAYGYGWGSSLLPDCDGYQNYGCNASQGGANGYRDDDDSAENAPRPMVIFYTRDGNGYGANDYWQEDGVVHLATTAGSEKTFPMSELDAKKTAEENAARGVYFTLFNTPLMETGPQMAAVSYTAPACVSGTQQLSASGNSTVAHFGAAGDATDGGVVVTAVQPGSLALQAGIHAGDKVTRIGCTDVHNLAEIDSAIAANSGETVWVSYMIHGSWLSEKPVKMR